MDIFADPISDAIQTDIRIGRGMCMQNLHNEKWTTSFLSRMKIDAFSLSMISAIVVFLIPALYDRTSLITQAAFFLGIAIVLVGTMNPENIIYYFLFIMINRGLLQVPLLFLSSYTITVVINSYLGLYALYCIIFQKARKTCIVPLWYYLFILVFHIIQPLALGRTDVFFSDLLQSFLMIGLWNLQFVATKNGKQAQRFVWILYVSAIVIVLLGFVELLIQRTFFYSLWTNEERFRYGIMRVGSTLGDPNFLCLTHIFLLFFFQTNIAKVVCGKKAISLVSLLIVIQCILTFSRTGIVAMLGCYMLLFMHRHKKVYLLIPFLVIAVLFVGPSIVEDILAMDSSSTGARMHVINASIGVIKENLIFGGGTDAFLVRARTLVGSEIATMNAYFDRLVATGIAGLVWHLLYYAIIIKQVGIIRLLKSYSLKAQDTCCVFVAVIGIMLMNMSLDTYFVAILWTIPAVLAVVNQCYID